MSNRVKEILDALRPPPSEKVECDCPICSAQRAGFDIKGRLDEIVSRITKDVLGEDAFGGVIAINRADGSITCTDARKIMEQMKPAVVAQLAPPVFKAICDHKEKCAACQQWCLDQESGSTAQN